MKVSFCLLCALLLSFVMRAQEGSLDPSYGNNGVLKTIVFDSTFNKSACALQSDGKLVSVFKTNDNKLSLVRYTAQGIIDSSFGATPLDIGMTNSGAVLKTVVQSDGKIIVSTTVPIIGLGMMHTMLRFNAGGTLDSSFGTNGIARGSLATLTPSITEMVQAVQPDNKLVLTKTVSTVGGSDVLINRLNANGSADPTFTTTSVTISNYRRVMFHSLTLYNGKIFVGATALGALLPTLPEGVSFLNCFLPNGRLDSSFGNKGIAMVPPLQAFTVQSDGTILVVSANNAPPKLYRFSAAGAMDSTLTSATLDSLMTVNKIIVQSDGKIVVGGIESKLGDSANVYLARYNADGTLNTTFGNNGATFQTFLATKNFKPVTSMVENNGRLYVYNAGLAESYQLVPQQRQLLALKETNVSKHPVKKFRPLTVFPNPTTNYFTLHTAENGSTYSVQVVDAAGRTVEAFTTTKSYVQFGNNYHPGFYYVVVSDGKEKSVTKLIKQ